MISPTLSFGFQTAQEVPYRCRVFTFGSKVEGWVDSLLIKVAFPFYLCSLQTFTFDSFSTKVSEYLTQPLKLVHF